MLKPIEKSDQTLEDELKKLQEARERENSNASPEDLEAAAILADPDKHSKEDSNWAKRFSDTKSAWHKDNNKNEATIASQAEEIAALKAKDPANIPTDAEGLAEWKKKNPALAAAIQSIAQDMATKSTESLQGQVKTLETTNETNNKELVKAKVIKAHPEFNDFAKDILFHDWIKEQPKWVETALYEGQDAKLAIQAITLYKAENNLLGDSKKKPGRPRNDAADGAKVVLQSSADSPTDSDTKGILKESDILKWTEEDWVKNNDLYNKAKAEGKLFYDVTGRR